MQSGIETDRRGRKKRECIYVIFWMRLSNLPSSDGIAFIAITFYSNICFLNKNHFVFKIRSLWFFRILCAPLFTLHFFFSPVLVGCFFPCARHIFTSLLNCQFISHWFLFILAIFQQTFSYFSSCLPNSSTIWNNQEEW